MSVRRLAPAEIQPPSFAFSAENAVWAGHQIAKYPDGRQASAVIPLLWRAQKQAGGWVPQKAIEHVAEVLGMGYIRVLEIATFYTMFNLVPVGRHFVQLCGTTPCMLRGAQELRKQLVGRIGPEKTVSADGEFSWAEVECLGACCNAPMVQINDDFYEDLTPESLDKLLDDLAAGRPVKIGPQNGRVSSEPEGAVTTLTDSTLYDGSVVGAWRTRFEQEEKAKAEAAAAAAAAQAEAEAAKAQPATPATTRPEQKASDSPAKRVAEGLPPVPAAADHAASAATAPEQQERVRGGSEAPATDAGNTGDKPKG
ncbi:hypothetical protein GCM10010994_13780 [Chelatococcus reniformis]|uniref:NADH-quinone oxidoreductase subunit NuoE n=1 Tax=Chelatococcus reniformis TaxID=1494448 RepID=A0A916U2D6_9HYPH|nr:hypothetical protein GCM10010994_13780 [Chelatococcus reniformis]